MNKTLTGYVVKISKYKEYDAILSILTSSGISSFKVRGMYRANNKNAHALSLYSKGEYIVNYRIEGGNGTLIKASLLSFVNKIYTSLDYSLLYGIMGEISNKYHNFYEVFDYITVNIDKIDVNTAIIYCLKCIMKMEGVLPVGDKCVKCGTSSNIERLSLIQGGFLCHSCNDESIDKNEVLHSYHIIYKMDKVNLIGIKFNEEIAYYFIDCFFEYLENSIGLKLISRSVFNVLKK